MATAWLGQYCLFVVDLEESVEFYEALGLANTSRTDLGEINEAIVENPDKGGKLQLAQRVPQDCQLDMGNAFWKLYVGTNDIDRMYADAVDAGAEAVSPPIRLEQWPMSIAFVKDPSGYLVELTQRHPWQDGDSRTRAWLNQYCVYVSDLERTIAFYTTLGLECTSRTDIAHAKEAILENTEGGGRIQLAQRLDDECSIAMGTAMGKLYVNTDDCTALHRKVLEAGYSSVMEPTSPERWPVTRAFIADPDGYQIELVELHRASEPG
jgi:lactoylglutathione lyase